MLVRHSFSMELIGISETEKNLKDDSNIVGAFTHGTEFKILSVEGDEWYVVNAAGTVGYVNLADYWYFNVKSEATTTATRETTTTAQTTTKSNHYHRNNHSGT